MANSEDVLEMADNWPPYCMEFMDREAQAVNDDACELIEALADKVRELRRDRELLVKLHAAWTYPNKGSIGALLDEVAERIEPGVFGDAAMGGGEGEA